MKRRLCFMLVVMLCLLPMVVVAIKPSWILPWRSAELDACVGDYVLPSGVLLQVRREANELTLNNPPRVLRRATSRLYVVKSASGRLRFLVDDHGVVTGLDLFGKGPRVAAKKTQSAGSDSTVMVDVGGHHLRVNVAGKHHKGPTVLLETGVFGGLEGVSKCQADVAQFDRVVAYDHPGTGGSEPGPGSQSAAQVAGQLREALRKLSIEPPYTIVGMSMGGRYSRVFAHRFADDMAGLVWLDPTPDWDHLQDWCAEHTPGMGPLIRRAKQWMDLSLESRLYSSPEVGHRKEFEAMEETWREERAAWPLPDVPVVHITGAKEYRTDAGAAMKVKYFSAWLEERIPAARHILAKESGHGVYAKQPDLCLEAIRSVVNAAKSD